MAYDPDWGDVQRGERGCLNSALKPWQWKLARLEVAGGYSDDELALEVGHLVKEVRAQRKRPEYRRYRERLRQRKDAALVEREALDLAGEVVKETRKTWERKLELRDQDKNLAVANQACDWVLDRALPEAKAVEERVVRVTVSVEERARIDAVLAEAVEVEALPAPEDGAIGEGCDGDDGD